MQRTLVESVCICAYVCICRAYVVHICAYLCFMLYVCAYVCIYVCIDATSTFPCKKYMHICTYMQSHCRHTAAHTCTYILNTCKHMHHIKRCISGTYMCVSCMYVFFCMYLVCIMYVCDSIVSMCLYVDVLNVSCMCKYVYVWHVLAQTNTFTDITWPTDLLQSPQHAGPTQGRDEHVPIYFVPPSKTTCHTRFGALPRAARVEEVQLGFRVSPTGLP